MEEKEIKIQLLNKNISIDLVKEKLEKTYDILFENQENVRDFYFDINNKFFNLNHALRIRDIEGKSFLAYKALFRIPKREENPWFILEREFQFPVKRNDFLELINLIGLNNEIEIPEEINRGVIEEIFSKLGLKKTIIIEKIRHSSDKNKGFQILVDFIKDLGLFIEIEFLTGNTNDILEKLTEPYKRIIHGYTNIYAKNILNLEIPDFDKKYNENPDWNYLPGQKEIVEALLELK